MANPHRAIDLFKRALATSRAKEAEQNTIAANCYTSSFRFSFSILRFPYGPPDPTRAAPGDAKGSSPHGAPRARAVPRGSHDVSNLLAMARRGVRQRPTSNQPHSPASPPRDLTGRCHRHCLEGTVRHESTSERFRARRQWACPTPRLPSTPAEAPLPGPSHSLEPQARRLRRLRRPD